MRITLIAQAFVTLVIESEIQSLIVTPSRVLKKGTRASRASAWTKISPMFSIHPSFVVSFVEGRTAFFSTLLEQNMKSRFVNRGFLHAR
jgi:hypothetical protein